MKRAFPVLAGALALSGCITPSVPTGTTVPLEELIRQIKSDVGQYNAYAAEHINDAPLNTACGGRINLAVKAITVSVTTSAKQEQSGTIGAEVTPFPFLKLGGSGGMGRGFENSQNLTFTVIPVSPGSAPSAAGQQDALPPSQLLTVLRGLRESLLKASDKTPCLTFPTAEDQENSVEFGFTATKTNSVGGSVNLFIFAIGGSRSNERTAAHTITIAFVGTGVSFVQ